MAFNIRTAALILGLLVCQASFAEIINGRVVAVTDGDTIKVLDDSKTLYIIRLAGIDAPEKSQAFGKASKQALSDLVYDQNVTVDTHKLDRYQRHIGKVILNGKDINLTQIKTGMAWYYGKYGFELLFADRQKYSDAQGFANVNRIGLWAGQEQLAPWEYRKSKKRRAAVEDELSYGTIN